RLRSMEAGSMRQSVQPRFGSVFKSRHAAAIELGEKMFSKLQQSGFDVRRQPAICSAAASRARFIHHAPKDLLVISVSRYAAIKELNSCVPPPFFSRLSPQRCSTYNPR